MTPERIDELIEVYRDGLLNSTMPFWQRHNQDREGGGFYNYLDADGSVLSTDKPVWVQGRYTWLTALLYNQVGPRPEWLELSRHGIEFLEKHCFDDAGRMFYEVTRDGRPLRQRRYLYTETFGVIAFAEYALASGDEARLAKAKELYRLLLHYHRTPGLLPPKGYPGTRPAKSHAMPMILLATSQQLRKTGDDPLYEEVIDQSIHEVTEHFMRYDESALLETVGPNGERIDSPDGRCVNPGHAIETAWFLMSEGRHRGEKGLIEKACVILDWSLELGWDKEFGGILYFVDVEGKPCLQYEHDMKLWWPHNESIYACLLAYHLTGDEKYAHWHAKVHDWAYAHFPDPEHGAWLKYLHRDGSVSSTVKGNAWAGPFHVPRMQLYCWQLLEEMQRQGAQG